MQHYTIPSDYLSRKSAFFQYPALENKTQKKPGKECKSSQQDIPRATTGDTSDFNEINFYISGSVFALRWQIFFHSNGSIIQNSMVQC